MAQLSALVVGGGVGGLTAALALSRVGCSVTVFEQAETHDERGAGIQLSPNSTRVLHHLGLEPALRACAVLPRVSQFRHWQSGRVIAQAPLGDEVRKRYGFPYYHIHRQDLLEVLQEAASANPSVEMVKGAAVADFSESASGVCIEVGAKAYAADVLIGADGIHSMVRERLFGADPATFTGNVAWRMLVPGDQLPASFVLPMASVWWGPGKHFVHYPVRKGKLVNCVCVVEKQGWEVESWTAKGEVDELRQDFAGWHEDIGCLIESADTDSLYKWALHDRPPMAQWGRGRVSLLGDACHPTLPFMAQGAAMAIEDSAVLADCLAAGSLSGQDPEASLASYESLRKSRTASVQAGSRRNARLFHARGLGAWVRDRGARFGASRTMDSLFRYDAFSATQTKGER